MMQIQVPSIKVPRTLSEAGKVGGSATYKQSTCSLKSVCLFSHENKESLFIHFVSNEKQNESMKIFLFWLKYIPQNYIVHLFK